MQEYFYNIWFTSKLLAGLVPAPDDSRRYGSEDEG